MQYIELLEKVNDAFDRIPNCIKDKLPGFDKRTYAKIKSLKSKLKTVIQKKNHTKSPRESSKKLQHESKHTDSHIVNTSEAQTKLESYDDEDLNDFDLKSSQITGKKEFTPNLSPNLTSNSLATSTPDIINFNKVAGPSKTIYSDLMAKKSLSFDAFSPSNDSSKNLETSVQSDNEILDKSENANKSKGKFVFKRPSRLMSDDSTSKAASPVTSRDVPSSTLERLKIASEGLRPVAQQEQPKCAPIANSSVDFQPPQLSRNLLNFNKPCTIVSPIVKENPYKDLDTEYDIEDDNEVPADIDDYNDIMPEESQSIINISDSIPSTSNVEVVNNKEIPVDDDGWPEYRMEDFEDEMGTQATEVSKEPEVMNLMDQSMTNGPAKPKYEGMGDFQAGTKNDGITGDNIIYFNCVSNTLALFN